MSERMSVIVVDRSTVFGKPDYCIHGETFCVHCNRACWLGDKSVEAVKGGIAPLCLDCANELWKDLDPEHVPSAHVTDHRREDGPH